MCQQTGGLHMGRGNQTTNLYPSLVKGNMSTDYFLFTILRSGTCQRYSCSSGIGPSVLGTYPFTRISRQNRLCHRSFFLIRMVEPILENSVKPDFSYNRTGPVKAREFCTWSDGYASTYSYPSAYASAQTRPRSCVAMPLPRYSGLISKHTIDFICPSRRQSEGKRSSGT